MNQTKIDWGLPNLWSWNPVVGCPNGCKYCYAKRLNDRYKFIPDFSKMTYYENRLNEPYKEKKSANIFVGSMSDMGNFGNVYPDILRKIYNVCYNTWQHTFYFLSKNPVGLMNTKTIPENCYIGATLTFDKGQLTAEQRRYHNFKNICIHSKRFISAEPLLGICNFDLSFVDFIIVGGMTGAGSIRVRQEWIESVKHQKIYYKNNLK